MAKAPKAASAPAVPDGGGEVDLNAGNAGGTEDNTGAAEEGALFEGTGEEGMIIDLSGTDENASSFVVIPKGIYDAVIDECNYSLSQRSNNPMWTWILELEESAGDFKGRKVFFHLPFTANMLPRIKKVLNRVAPDLAATKFNPKEVADQGTLSGVRCKVRLDQRRYEGEMRNNVRDILPPGQEGGTDFLST